MQYEIRETNKFNSKILGKVVAMFDSLELAKEYADFKAKQGESYVVAESGKVIYE